MKRDGDSCKSVPTLSQSNAKVQHLQAMRLRDNGIISHACWPHRTLHTDRLLWLINLPQYDMIIGKGAYTCHTELSKWLLFVQHGRILLRETFLILSSDSSSAGRHTDWSLATLLLQRGGLQRPDKLTWQTILVVLLKASSGGEKPHIHTLLRCTKCWPFSSGKNPSVSEGSNYISHHRLFMMLFHCRRVHWSFLLALPRILAWTLFDNQLTPIHSSDKVSLLIPSLKLSCHLHSLATLLLEPTITNSGKVGRVKTLFLAHKAQNSS